MKGYLEKWGEVMEDSKIVELYWERSELAIPATAEKYGNYCAAIARNILGSRQDAEECVNDTYLNVWNAIPPHRPGVLSAFLGKITRNLALNRYRKNHTDKRGGGELPLVFDELEDCISDKDNVERAIDRKELVKAIDAFLATLSPEKRGIFICRYWYFDSISDIAERFGRTENSVSVILSRLRGKLHDYLMERGFEL